MIFEQAWSDLIKAIDMPDDLNFMINEIESINPFARRDGTTAEFLAHADPALRSWMYWMKIVGILAEAHIEDHLQFT